VAVLALGTGLEWLARRLAGNAARAAGRALISPDRKDATRQEAGASTIEELLYIRKVNIRP